MLTLEAKDEEERFGLKWGRGGSHGGRKKHTKMELELYFYKYNNALSQLKKLLFIGMQIFYSAAFPVN